MTQPFEALPVVICGCGGKGYTQTDYGISVLTLYCTCPAGVAYKAERLKAMAR